MSLSPADGIRGLVMSSGTFYKDHLLFGASDSQIGILGSIPPSLVLGLSFTVRRLVDTQYHGWLLGVGGILTPLGYLCLSFTSGEGLDGQGNYGPIFLDSRLDGWYCDGLLLYAWLLCRHSSNCHVDFATLCFC